MACCKPCCGCADCTEGQEGKCCCPSQGPDGTCCSEGEYCCDGACQPEPCDECPLCNLAAGQTVGLTTDCFCEPTLDPVYNTATFSEPYGLGEGSGCGVDLVIDTECCATYNGVELCDEITVSVLCCKDENDQWRLYASVSWAKPPEANFGDPATGQSECNADITIDEYGMLDGSVTFDLTSGNDTCSVTLSFN